jgi:hypothetical protein
MHSYIKDVCDYTIFFSDGVIIVIYTSKAFVPYTRLTENALCSK